MIGIMSDQDVVGLTEKLLKQCRFEWGELFDELDVKVVSFEDLGLRFDSRDSQIWHACQRRSVILLTANRNERLSELSRPSSILTYFVAPAGFSFPDRAALAEAWLGHFLSSTLLDNSSPVAGVERDLPKYDHAARRNEGDSGSKPGSIRCSGGRC